MVRPSPPQQESGSMLGVDPKQAAVLQDHPASALAAEVNGTDGEVRAGRLERAKGPADAGDIRIGENDAQRRAAQPGANIGEAAGVLPGNPALIGRLVQQRDVAVDVTGEEDVGVAALHREAVEPRYAALVQVE